MSSSLILGRYVPTGSILHRLDPRAKFLSLLLLIPVVLIAATPGELACCALVLWALTALSRIPWRALLGALRPLLFLAAFTLVFNVVFPLWAGASLASALGRGAFTASRLVVLMTFALLLPLTTAPLEIADGTEALLEPLARFGFPTRECATMVGMAMRFIPLLMEETDRITRAQLSRGARLDQGGPLRRIVALFPVLIPLFVIIFRRADEMALALEVRGYDGGRRTRMRPLRWGRADTAALALSACGAALFLWERSLG